MKRSRSPVHPWFRWFMLVSPTAATAEGWDRIKRMQKRNHPIRYFLQNELTHKARMVKVRFDRSIWWVKYRTVERYHVHKIHGLRPGYADTDRLMLYVNFSLLIDHVEVGLSCRNFEWHDNRRPKFLPKFLASRLRRMRCPEAGLDHLRWEYTDEDILLQSPEQAVRAKALEHLYLWWTDYRRKRLVPYSDSLIWEGVEKTTKKDIFSLMGSRDSNYRTASEIANKATEFYEMQDQAMLEALIKLRVGLWC